MSLVGKRIELLDMPNDPCPIPKGTTGTIVQVTDCWDGTQQIWVDWDIQRSLSLIVPPDQYQVIGD